MEIIKQTKDSSILYIHVNDNRYNLISNTFTHNIKIAIKIKKNKKKQYIKV